LADREFALLDRYAGYAVRPVASAASIHPPKPEDATRAIDLFVEIGRAHV
jgi:hypothetical protein